MDKPRVYLAGQITGLTYAEAETWRDYAKTLFPPNVEAVSPLRAKDYLREHGVLADQYLDVHPLSTSKGITTRDRNDVRCADVVLMNLLGMNRVSVGCMIELGWADAYRVPVVLVMEKDNPHQHGMAQHIAGWVTDDLKEAVFICCSILGEDVLSQFKAGVGEPYPAEAIEPVVEFGDYGAPV